MKRLKRYAYEKYAILCQLAYPNDGKYKPIFDQFEQIEIFDRFKKSCVRVVWQTHKKEVVVVFRGSHNVYDWLLNLCLFQTPFQISNSPKKRYSIHWGMNKLLSQPSYSHRFNDKKPLTDRLMQALMPLSEQGKRITFIGHSTGGSMAVLFADRFSRHDNVKVKRVVTFGQPSCGGQGFFRHYQLHHKTYRVCCDVDIVTFLPPLPLYYRHVGKSLWLHEGVMFENIRPSKRLWLSIKSWLLRPITYHYMNKYIRNKSLFDEN